MTHDCGVKNLMKYRGLYDRIQLLCETVQSPLNLKMICQDYKKESNCVVSSQHLETKVRDYRRCIIKCLKLSPVNKVKHLFALSEPITAEFHEKLMAAHIHVTLDSRKRIIVFDDGVNFLQGNHSSTQKHRQTVTRDAPSAGREEQQQFDDAQQMIVNAGDQIMNPIKDQPTSSAAAVGNMTRRQPSYNLAPNGGGQFINPTQNQPATSTTAARTMARGHPSNNLVSNGGGQFINPTQNQPATSTTAARTMARGHPSNNLVSNGSGQFINPTQNQPATSTTAARTMARGHPSNNLVPNGGGQFINSTQNQPATSTTAAETMARRTIPFAKHEKLFLDIQDLVKMDFGGNNPLFFGVHRRMDIGIANLQDFQLFNVEETRELKMDDLLIGLKSFVLVLRKESRTSNNEESRGLRDFILNFRYILFKLKLPELNEFVSELEELAKILSPQLKISLEKFEFALKNFLSIIAP